MTDIEKTKNYLNQVRNADKMIDFKQQRLDELNAQAACIRSPDYSDDKVQTSPSGDAIPRIVAKIIDMQEEINGDIDSFIDLKAEVMHTIDKLQNADEITVLYGLYFEYKIIADVAKEIHCGKRTAQRIHKRALEKLSRYVTA